MGNKFSERMPWDTFSIPGVVVTVQKFSCSVSIGSGVPSVCVCASGICIAMKEVTLEARIQV